MTATGTPDERKGCGVKEATRVVFRGRKRLYLCADCPYEGGGRVSAYKTEVEGEERGGAVFMGPRHVCGDETA